MDDRDGNPPGWVRLGRMTLKAYEHGWCDFMSEYAGSTPALRLTG